MSNSNAQKTVFILGLSSDIGQELANRYFEKGFAVIGTCRNSKKLKGYCDTNHIHSIPCGRIRCAP